MLELILTYDLGTTSCKTTLFTLEGRIKYQTSKEYKTYFPKDGWAEQDAEDWWRAVVDTTRTCVQKVNEEFKICAISLSSQRETFVPVDSQGKPIYRAVLWMDRRNTSQVCEMENVFGRKYLHDTTGMILFPNFTSTKLLWFKQHEPAVLNSTYKILQPRDYIYLKLTGMYATDYSLASRTMMLGLKDKKWVKEIMDYVGVNESMLPEIYQSHEAPGKILNEISNILNINRDVPVVLGGGDRCCEALGSGVKGREAMESTATAGNVSFVSDTLPEELNEKIVCTLHAVKNKWLMEQGLNTTGSLLKWLRDSIYGPGFDYEMMDDEIVKSPIGSNKLLMLPFFMGAKSTRFNQYARGTLFGLSLSHSRGDIGRSIMEGVAFENRACIDVLCSSGMDVSDITLMGGGSKADIWNQIKADVYNKIIRIPQTTEASSFGAFVLGGYSIGLFKDPEEAARNLNPAVKEFHPCREHNELYMKYYNIYNELYNSVEPLFKELDEI